MDTDLKELVEENLRLTKDNNRMLRSMRRTARISFVWRIIFWAAILGIPTYIYITYIAPMMSSIFPPGTENANPILKMLGLPSSEALRQAMHTFSNFFNTIQHFTQAASSSPK